VKEPGKPAAQEKYWCRSSRKTRKKERPENYTAFDRRRRPFPHRERPCRGRYRIFHRETRVLSGVNEHGLKSDVNVFHGSGGSVGGRPCCFECLPTAVISGPHYGRRWRSDVWRQSRRTKETTREINERKASGPRGTNDLGEYRIAGLFSRPVLDCGPCLRRTFAITKSRRKWSAGEAQPDTRYVNTYYPGTYDALLASAVTLKAGDENAGQLHAGAGGERIAFRGIITGVTSRPRSPQWNCSPKRAILTGRMRMKIGPGGEFEVRGVAPGSYVLKASSGTDSLVANCAPGCQASSPLTWMV